MTHNLKCHPQYFPAILDGSKRFELRRNDRDFNVGDVLVLEEWDPASGTYTGRACRAPVTYITGGETWLRPEHVAMSLGPVTRCDGYALGDCAHSGGTQP